MAFKDSIYINGYDFKVVQNQYRYRIKGSSNLIQISFEMIILII